MITCGRNDFGQLCDGTNNSTNDNNLIVKVELHNRAARLLGVGPSAQSVLFYTDLKNRRVWGTGLNDRGQLGIDNTKNKNMPRRVQFKGPVDIDLLSVSESHNFVLGTVMGWYFRGDLQ